MSENTNGPAGDGTAGPRSNTPTANFTAKLDIAAAPRADCARWTASTVTWPDLLLSLAEPADHRECGGYVLGRLKFGKRDLDHLVNRCAVVLDPDKAASDLIDRVRALGYTVAWHTTWRHTPEAPRYRLIFPTARLLNGDEYRATADELMDRLGREQFDVNASRSPVQFMWRPSTQDRGTYQHGSQDGELVPTTVPPAAPENVPERPAPDRTPAELDAYTRSAVDDELARLDRCAELGWGTEDATGLGWDQTCYAVACNLVEIANSKWSGYTLDQAHKDFLDRAPSDEKFGRREHEDKWSSAAGKVGDRPDPHAAPFDVVADEAAPSERAALSLVSLADFLAEPHEPTQYRLDGLLPVGGRAVLAAQFKSGKTTLRDNLVRSLADEVPFLGEFAVTPLDDGRTIVVLDNEMNRDQMREWLRDQAIVNVDRVKVLVLRGRVQEFNLLDAEVRARWAAMLREANAGFVIFDCLRAVLDALGLDENHDSGTFFVAFDALLEESGGAEALVVHHMGHSNDRARGDSRIRDWPDAEWRLLRKGRPGADPDPSDPRYFSAYGRDVDVPERGVDFDRSTRHLTLNGGNRHSVATDAALADVLTVVAAEGAPMSKTAIELALKGDHTQKAIRDAVDIGVKDGRLAEQKGAHRARLISLSVSPS